MATSKSPSPAVVEKVTHYLHNGFHDRSHGIEEIPPALGDARWTPELILSTWYAAETGLPPEDLEHQVGHSGGGFDKLDFKPNPRWALDDKAKFLKGAGVKF